MVYDVSQGDLPHPAWPEAVGRSCGRVDPARPGDEPASARLFYAPAYYGAGRSAYLDLGRAWPLGGRLRFGAHVGILHLFDASLGRPGRLDTRPGLAADVGDLTLQLAGRRSGAPMSARPRVRWGMAFNPNG